MNNVWKKVDLVVIFNFTDYWLHPLINKYINTNQSFSPNTQYEGVLLLKKRGKPIWLSHPFNYAQAKKEFKKINVQKYTSLKELGEIIQKNSKQKIGVDFNHTSLSYFNLIKKISKGKKIVDVSKELGESRETKNEEEIKKIKKAVSETKRVIKIIKKELKEKDTEKKVFLRIKNLFEENNFELGFCIVAFGKNTANIHHAVTQTKLRKENPVLIDVGAKYKGYCADLTTSFWFGKKEPINYSKKKEEVISALKRIEQGLREGTKASELWGYSKLDLPHALGHGIGVEVHDYPTGIGKKTNWVLKKNMVLAIEPAIYIKEFGVRIENNYLITKKGFKKL